MGTDEVVGDDLLEGSGRLLIDHPHMKRMSNSNGAFINQESTCLPADLVGTVKNVAHLRSPKNLTGGRGREANRSPGFA